MYEDALISKMFVFSFVNSYASLFFVAFIKTYIGESCTGGCFSELSYQLTTIFGLDLCPSFVNMLVVLLSNKLATLTLAASKLTVAKISSYFTLVVNRKLKDREVQKEYEEHKLRLQREKNSEDVYIPEVSKAEKVRKTSIQLFSSSFFFARKLHSTMRMNVCGEIISWFLILNLSVCVIVRRASS